MIALGYSSSKYGCCNFRKVRQPFLKVPDIMKSRFFFLVRSRSIQTGVADLNQVDSLIMSSKKRVFKKLIKFLLSDVKLKSPITKKFS